MINWIDIGDLTPPKNKALLCYCPKCCAIGYVVAVWNGANFKDEIRGEDIKNDYVEKWAIIFGQDYTHNCHINGRKP